MNIDRIKSVLNFTEKMNITIIGDYCLDKYLYIDASKDEQSLETGLTSYQVVKKAVYPGVSGTITNNLCSLGARVICLGFVGIDGEGFELLKCLEEIGADTSYMIKSHKVCTNTYTKPIRMENERYSEMSRLDFKNFNPTPEDLQEEIIRNLKKAIKISDAVILSDQFYEINCSVITERVRQVVADLALEHPDIIFFADSRAFVNRFRNVIVKCNNFEAAKSIMPEYNGEITKNIIYKCGLKLYELNNKTVFITMGEEGSIVFDKSIIQVPPFKINGPMDICGAGDANTAGIVLGLTLGLDIAEAALLGNAVSSITIEQIGVTGTATIQQVIERLS